jgi:hypothetical protein
LFALADKIESRVALATERVEKTTQAILAKAFRGELVPTEAELARQQNRDYEPASVLLERIERLSQGGTTYAAEAVRWRIAPEKRQMTEDPEIVNLTRTVTADSAEEFLNAISPIGGLLNDGRDSTTWIFRGEPSDQQSEQFLPLVPSGTTAFETKGTVETESPSILGSER